MLYYIYYLQYLFQKTYKLKIDKSSIHGLGVFADEDIPKYSVIIAYFKDNTTNKYNQYNYRMNDADFDFPKDWNYETIKNSLESSQTNNKNNTWFISHPNVDNYFIVANRNINKGEEITKKYKMNKWGLFMAWQMLFSNPFDPQSYIKEYKIKEQDIANLKNLHTALKYFGCELIVKQYDNKII